MKSLRFRHCPLALAIIASGGAWVLTARADIAGSAAECVQEFQNELRSLKRVKDRKVTEVDGAAHCALNQKHKYDRIDEKAAATKPKLEIDGDDFMTKSESACASSYEAAKIVYDELVKYREKTCNEIYARFNQFPDCLGKADNTCQEHLADISATLQSGNKKITGAIQKSRDFIAPYAKANAAVVKKYKSDLNALKGLEPPELAKSARGKIIAAESDSLNLQDYRAKLNGEGLKALLAQERGIPRNLVQEQEDAATFAQEFSQRLGTLKDKIGGQFNADLKAYKEKIENTTGKDGPLDGVVRYAPVAAPLATALGGNAVSGATAGISGGSLASAALPAALAAGAGLGAAALSASAASKNAAAAKLNDSADAPGAPKPVVASTDLAEEDKPAPVPTTPLAAGPAPLETAVPEAAENIPAPNATEPGSGTSSAGFSSAKAGGPKRDVASKAAPNADDALKTFSGNLQPGPRPVKADTTGTDVSSLLGKMKDLFNLDDAPADMAAGFTAPAISSAPTAAGQSAEGESEEYSAEGEGYEAEEYSAEAETEGSGPYGRSDVTLFHRVHGYLNKSIKSGRITQQMEELPQ